MKALPPLGRSALRPSAALASLRLHILAGLVVCGALVAGFGGWAATAELAGAVIAPGTVVVETGLKKVQHPTGGVVGELRVADGTVVKAGDVLIRLDETVTRANLDVVLKTLDELEGRRARLMAERDGADALTFPADLVKRADGDAEVGALVAGERALFAARRTARDGKKEQLRARIGQLDEEISGLEAQRASKVSQSALIAKELGGVEGLYERNLVTIARVAALQREAAKLLGEQGEIVASTAQARGRISEIELQLIQIDQDVQTEVLKELRELDGKLGELAERRITAEDQLRRIDIRSPRDGVVHQLAVHTVGGVIGPGETLMFVVPQADALTVEAHVAAQDIDQVAAGQRALVRFPAFSQRTTPELAGEVWQVDGDLTREPQSNAAYYVARVRLPADEVAKLHGLKLVPGMPAEVHIRTGERTALSYLVKPLTDQIARAFKEE